MKDENGRAPNIAGVQVTVGENEVKEGVTLTSPR
jgi:hypothetical protein